MAPSDEVNDAVGEMPVRDPVQLLDAKRDELVRTEEHLAAAQQSMDVDAEVLARQRATVLRDQIARLEPEAAAVFDKEGAEQARDWLARQHENLQGIGEQITTVQARAKKILKELLGVIREEAALRSQVTNEQVAQEFVILRWPDLAQLNGQTPTLPPFADYETPIIAAVSDLLPRRGLRIMDRVPTQGNDTPETLRKKVLRALHEFMSGTNNVKALGPEVAGIIARAGIPDWETPEERTQREEREAQRRTAADSLITLTGRAGSRV